MLITSAVLLGVVVAMASVVWHVDGPIAVDRVRYLAPDWGYRWTFFSRLSWPGWFEFVVAAVVVLAVLECVRRDWFAAVLCVAGPGLAAFLVEFVAKPTVDRRIGGALSFPSGHTTLVSALATLLVLLAYRFGGPRAAAAATPPLVIVVGAVAIGIVQMRAHYLTDAVGGVALGVGAVLGVAAVLSALWPRLVGARR